MGLPGSITGNLPPTTSPRLPISSPTCGTLVPFGASSTIPQSVPRRATRWPFRTVSEVFSCSPRKWSRRRTQRRNWLTRHALRECMTATESTETLTLYQLTLLTAFFALLLPLGWTSPTPVDAAWIVLNGVSNAVGQYWWTRALHLAPASAVAPFFYLSLIWASILGFAIWGDIPTVSLVIGSAVVVASGLFLLWRESNSRQAKLPAN